MLQLSSVELSLDHYMRHALSDTGDKKHDCCYTVLHSKPNRIDDFKHMLSVIKKLDFVWLIQTNNTYYQLTSIVVGYMCENKRTLKDIAIYGHNPFVSSLGDLQESQYLIENRDVVDAHMQRMSPNAWMNFMWSTQTQCDF